MRKLGEDVRSAEKRITATTRQLESMIRLSEAHAKMRLSQDVTVDDVREAVELMKRAIKDYAMDPLTGEIDMDLVSTGTSAAQRQRQAELKDQVLSVLGSDSDAGPVYFSDIQKRLIDEYQRGVGENELFGAVKSLEDEQRVKIDGVGSRRKVRRIFGTF
jgi:DNA replication licensing factor MCM4